MNKMPSLFRIIFLYLPILFGTVWLFISQRHANESLKEIESIEKLNAHAPSRLKFYQTRSTKSGFQNKQGMVNPQYFLYKHKKLREKIFAEWVRAKIEGVDQLVSPPPVPYPECQIVINHHYKFIWIKGHKVGGSTLLTNLAEICIDPHNVSIYGHKYCSMHFDDKNYNVDAFEIEKYWKEYFVFGFIRNPYARFVSGYQYLKRQSGPFLKRNHRLDSKCIDFLWPQEYCSYYRCDNNTDILSIPDINFYHKHYKEQSPCFYTENLLPAVDFIGETEEMKRDIGIIIDFINKRKNANLPKLPKTLHSININPQRKRYTRIKKDVEGIFFNKKKGCISAINQVLNKDFLLLGYNMHIP